MALHPTEFGFASASADSIKQWRCPRGDFVQNFEGHKAIVNSLSANADGVLASGGDDGSLRFWDWRSGHCFQETATVVQPGSLDGEAGIFCSTFDRSGFRLLTGEADKTIKIWREDDEATEESHPVDFRPTTPGMRDPVYTYCREVLPPSVVERAASLCFTRDGASNLALARGNVLEVYEVELVLRSGPGDDGEVPGDEYLFRDAHAEEFDFPVIRDDAKARDGAGGGKGRSGRGGAKRPQLRLVGRWSLHGKIMDVQPVRRSKARLGLDWLLLSFAEAKMSLVSFDAGTQSIVTESIHYYEHESLKKRTFNDNQTCDMRADPEYRCVALRLYDDQLAVLPFAAPGGVLGADSAKPYADSF
ncbi:pre-mRNA-splicing factor prp46, partial [Coemansia nantahalensis]